MKFDMIDYVEQKLTPMKSLGLKEIYILHVEHHPKVPYLLVDKIETNPVLDFQGIFKYNEYKLFLLLYCKSKEDSICQQVVEFIGAEFGIERFIRIKSGDFPGVAKYEIESRINCDLKLL